MLTRCFSVLAALALLCLPSIASDTNVFPPNRAPDFVVSTGQVEPNYGFTSGANSKTYPMIVKAADEGVRDVVYQMTLKYKYKGPVLLMPQALGIANIASEATHIYWLGHKPNTVNPQWGITYEVAPVEWAFNGMSAGGGGAFATLAPGGSTLLENEAGSLTTFQQDVGAPFPFLTFKSEEPLKWREVHGQRPRLVNGEVVMVPLHSIWLTPVAQDSWAWGYQSLPNAPLSHVVNYQGRSDTIFEMKIWYVRHNEPPLVLAPL